MSLLKPSLGVVEHRIGARILVRIESSTTWQCSINAKGEYSNTILAVCLVLKETKHCDVVASHGLLIQL